jgi:hypothetical protein
VDLVRYVQTRSFSVFSFVNVVNLPFLTQLISELGNSYVLTLTVLLVDDFNDSAIFNILEVVLRELESLEPTSIGGPELQVVCVSRVLDIKRLVLMKSVHDCPCLLVEVPDLRIKFIWSLDHYIGTDDIQVSLLTTLRNNVEWPFDVKTILTIELTFAWFFWWWWWWWRCVRLTVISVICNSRLRSRGGSTEVGSRDAL